VDDHDDVEDYVKELFNQSVVIVISATSLNFECFKYEYFYNILVPDLWTFIQLHLTHILAS